MAYITFVYQKAVDVIKQQNFQCNQESLSKLDSLIIQINQGIYSGVPSQLFVQADEHLRRPLISVYLDYLKQYKDYIAYIYQKAQNAVSQQNFRCDLHSLEHIKQKITELSQGNRNNVPQELFLNVNERDKDSLVSAYISILDHHKTQIEQKLLEEQRKAQQEQQRLEELRRTQKQQHEELRRTQEQQRLETLRKEQQRRQEELNRKQETAALSRDQEEQCRFAEELIDTYVRRINTFLVTFRDTTSIEIIKNQQTTLLQQLTAITKDKHDLLSAQIVLNIQGEAPQIRKAISAKTKEIISTAQQLIRAVEEQPKDLEAELQAALQCQQHYEKLQEQQQRERFIRKEESKIDNILKELAQKIGGIEQHHFEEALSTAENLLNTLHKAKIDYLNNLDSIDITIDDANEDFKQTCKVVIDEARSVLERDLNWGTYLTNLCKALGNIIILVATFGQINNFFKQERAESIRAVENAELLLHSMVSSPT